MDRRTLLGALPIAICAPLSARAQTTGRVYRLGVLAPGAAPQLSNAFIAAMADRGYRSPNLVVDIRYTQGNPDLAESLARELVAQRADVIVTAVTATAMAARRATKVVPIVMYISGYPVEGGLAQSLARPGGNVTGMTLYAGGGELFGKFVQLLRELRPSMRELGVFWGYAPPSYSEAQVAPATEELRQAARALNVKVHFWQTGNDSDLGAALSAAASAPLDALFVTAGVIHELQGTAARIARFIHQQRLPTLTDFPGSVFSAGGAVLSYSAELKELASRTAHFVARILEGARPDDLPIEQPTKYELIVNLKAAKTVGLDVPPALLARADRTISA
jgi:putative ABC transport system substrate-binding protein